MVKFIKKKYFESWFKIDIKEIAMKKHYELNGKIEVESEKGKGTCIFKKWRNGSRLEL